MINKVEEENYQKFLKGSFWVKGWNDRTKDILQHVPEKEKVELKILLSELGEKIGREWAKNPLVRKIDTQMLKKWGGEIKKALNDGPSTLIKQIRTIEHQVNKIIS
jgi:hypothetical protein